MNKKNLYLIIGGAVLVVAIVVALIFGLGGNKTETPNGDVTNPTINDVVENTTGEDVGETKPGETDDETQEETEFVEPDDAVVIPDDAKDGDVLEDGSVYFDDVVVDGADDIKNILDNYGGDKNDVMFTTPEYTGIVQRTDDSYMISKTSDKFTEDVIYMDIGIVNTNRCEYDNGVLVFQHTDSTEADYYVDIHYKDNTQKHEIIDDNGSIREVKEYETGSNYNVLTYVKYNGGEQWFEYTDKENKVLSFMKVVEDGGMSYTFTFDGGGNTEANVVSMTLTRNGSTTTYSKNDIPWQIGFVTPPGRLTKN
jgi:hypothetical protein